MSGGEARVFGALRSRVLVHQGADRSTSLPSVPDGGEERHDGRRREEVYVFMCVGESPVRLHDLAKQIVETRRILTILCQAKIKLLTAS